MQTFAVTVACVACGEVEYIYVEPMDYVRWTKGTHAQDAFPYLTADERDCLISNMCLDCLDEMYRDLVEEEEDEYSGWDESTHEEDCECAVCDSYNMGPLDPESDDPSYDSDYYVDRDCD